MEAVGGLLLPGRSYNQTLWRSARWLVLNTDGENLVFKTFTTTTHALSSGNRPHAARIMPLYKIVVFTIACLPPERRPGPPAIAGRKLPRLAAGLPEIAISGSIQTGWSSGACCRSSAKLSRPLMCALQKSTEGLADGAGRQNPSAVSAACAYSFTRPTYLLLLVSTLMTSPTCAPQITQLRT